MSEVSTPSAIFLADADGSWSPVAGLLVSKWRLFRELVDVTRSDDQGWRRLLPSAGVQAFDVEGEGVGVDPVTLGQLQEVAVAGSKVSFKIRLEPALTITGDFIIGAFEVRGEVDEEVTFAFVLNSAGPVLPSLETA
ncbi:hypothetical protein GCM10022281_01920 [Sphingomonas rosea]|uniref:Uncharacterized protein n=1 Tax=Sphingomonas rosea TaxID=335605 RepID=A0ABP7TJ13_9SPHN